MTASTVTADSPGRPLLDPDEAPRMPSHSLHAMPEVDPPAWSVINATSTGSFLPQGSVVPVSVLAFHEDGSTQGFLAQQVADRLTAEIRADLDELGIVYTPGEDEPTSGACGTRWPTEYGEFICTGSDHHSRDHKAHDVDGKVLASYSADVTVAAKPVRRRPTPKPRTGVA